MSKSKAKTTTAAEFDVAFEAGEDVSAYLDLKNVKKRYPMQQINIAFPKEVLEKVDLEAAKIGVTRTSLIKMWVAQHIHSIDRNGNNL